jgi:hypothetical protein
MMKKLDFNVKHNLLDTFRYVCNGTYILFAHQMEFSQEVHILCMTNGGEHNKDFSHQRMHAWGYIGNSMDHNPRFSQTL